MKNKFMISILTLFFFIFSVVPSYSYDLKTNEPLVSYEQAYACMKDRNASKEFLDTLEFVYKYSEEIGIDPTIVVAISAIETGYGHSPAFINKNNPGGIMGLNDKPRYFNSVKDGYRYMINLLGTYAGLVNKHSWVYGKAESTEELGNYYWVENGRDSGYHKQLTKMIKTMQSYPKNNSVDDIEEPKEEEKIEKKENKKSSALDIIYDIIGNNDDKFDAYNYIMSFTK